MKPLHRASQYPQNGLRGKNQKRSPWFLPVWIFVVICITVHQVAGTMISADEKEKTRDFVERLKRKSLFFLGFVPGGSRGEDFID